MPSRDTLQIIAAVFGIFAGILLLKITDLNLWWGLIFLSAAVGCHGGVGLSRLAGDG